MAQLVKVLAVKPDDLSSGPGSLCVKRRELPPTDCPLASICVL